MPELSASAQSAAPQTEERPQIFFWSWERDGPGSVKVRLAGELDLSDRPELRRALIEAGQMAASMAVDLHELTFIDCAAIATLLDAGAEAGRRGAEMRLLGASGQVERVLKLTGIPADVGRLDCATIHSRRVDSDVDAAAAAPWLHRVRTGCQGRRGRADRREKR